MIGSDLQLAMTCWSSTMTLRRPLTGNDGDERVLAKRKMFCYREIILEKILNQYCMAVCVNYSVEL